jgi:hypothetical protein
MKNVEEIKEVLESFGPSELISILEIARVALADAETFDYMADYLDMSDEQMQKLGNKLDLAMN